ncbi:hypothetical protein [Paraburkholderia tropica]|uniref:hypothetical protein n=1 Tax=Paraburkholderia tropica TaxID=92647 RepID=UPI002AB5E726|nr:hypothetical protein [Paraburkholderia tropica]
MTCDQQRFERDVAQHTMTVIRDDGVDRHIKFRGNDGSAYWFEILTWPGALCIRGDCGTYVFSRLTDMFEFFRHDRGGDASKLYINPGYWCEKLQAVNSNGYGNGSAKRFSGDQFRQRVEERVKDHLEGEDTTDERRADLLCNIRDEILEYVCDGGGQVAFHLLYQFHDNDFPDLFVDCDWNCDEYEFGFMWNLYAIAWAIRTYDRERNPDVTP